MVADLTRTELLLITDATTTRGFTKEIRANAAFYRLAN